MQLCNICLTSRSNIKRLECKHNICRKCYDQAIQSQRLAYCQTCLSPFQRSHHCNSQSSQEKQINQNKFYCLECFQPCSLENIRLGKHKNHNFEQIEKSHPFIQLKLDDQYQKSLQIQRILPQFFTILQQNCSLGKIDNQRKKIKQIFDLAKQSLQARQLELLSKLQILQNRIEQVQTQKKKKLARIYEEVQEITQKIEKYFDNSQQLIDIQIKQLCTNDSLNHIIDELQTLKINTIQVPQFIYCNFKSQFIQSNFYLIQRYHSQSHKQTIDHESSLIMNKRRVNLRSKILQKMNKF